MAAPSQLTHVECSSANHTRQTVILSMLDATTSAHTPPCIPLVNDPRATRLRINCVLSEHGYLRSTRRVPGFDLDASIAANMNAEFRTD